MITLAIQTAPVGLSPFGLGVWYGMALVLLGAGFALSMFVVAKLRQGGGV